MRRLITAITLAVAVAVPAARAADVTVVHGISGGPLGLAADLPVDIWVDGAPLLTGFTFLDVAGPVELPAGTYEIRVYLAGSDPATTEPVLALDATLGAEDDVDVVAHFTADGGIALTPFANSTTPAVDDAISPRISERDARFTVRHAAAFPRVAINRATFAFEPTLANGEGLSLDLDSGTLAFWLSVAGAPRPLSFAPISLDLGPGTSTTVYAVGSPADGSLTLLPIVAPLP